MLEAATVLQFADLTLDVENQLASRGNRRIELSDKEVQLLAYLMRSPHQLLTHTQIYEAVWGKGLTPSSNTLAAQMRLLRKKIEQAYSARFNSHGVRQRLSLWGICLKILHRFL